MAEFRRHLPAVPFIVPNRRLPMLNLYRFVNLRPGDAHALARRLAVEVASVERWEECGGVPDGTADVIAVDRLGVEPKLVWGAEWDTLDGWRLNDADEWEREDDDETSTV